MYQRVDTCHHGPMSGDVGVNYSRCLPEILRRRRGWINHLADTEGPVCRDKRFAEGLAKRSTRSPPITVELFRRLPA